MGFAMAPITRPLWMQHTAPGFWLFVLAYLLLGCGSLIILFEIADWAFMGKKLSLFAGLFSIWLGAICLARLKHTYAEPIATRAVDGSEKKLGQ